MTFVKIQCTEHSTSNAGEPNEWSTLQREQFDHLLLWWTVIKQNTQIILNLVQFKFGFCIQEIVNNAYLFQIYKNIFINLFCRHTKGADPVPISNNMRSLYNSVFISVGVPGVNGYLSPVDYQVSHHFVKSSRIEMIGNYYFKSVSGTPGHR